MTAAGRIVYAGTPAFAVPALERLVREGYDLRAVYTQPDRPAGRGRRLRPSPVKAAATELGLTVRQPESLRGEHARAELAALEPDAVIVAAYGQILSPEILAVPRHGCLNIHASLLPRWRGAAPIQRALLAGDEHTGVCLMRMAAGLDTGPVLACRSTAIAATDTGGSVHDRLAALGADLMGEPLADTLAGRLAPQDQPDTGVTYARKLDKEEARVDWGEPAPAIARRIRAFNPWPVAFARRGDEAVRLWFAEAVDARASAPPGTVLAVNATGVDVAAGAGVVRVTELQLPGRRRQSAADVANGGAIAVGERFAT